VRAIVLNGGSSSGKSSIAERLQAILPGLWLHIGVDTLIEAMPATGAGIGFAADGTVHVDDEFRTVESAWMTGVAAMVRAGARVVIDDVFLGGPASQQRWRNALGDLEVLWVGVRCDSTVAAARELTRGDRVPGMAASQADSVHQGVGYDLEVDTTSTDSLACARKIAARIT
jgi:chloramphenicol 3-O phosphotransferase